MFAHDAVISPCALPHRVARVARSCLAPCKDAARVVAPHRGFQSCTRRVPNSQTARPAALPHVFFASVARALAARCCARRCDLAVSLATSLCSRCSLLSCAVQGCGPRYCGTPRLPELPALRAEVANCSLASPLVTPRCLAGRLALRLFCIRRPRPHGALLRTTLGSRHAPRHITLLALLALVVRRARMRPALLRRSAASKAACAAPKSQTVLLILCRQRLAARPAFPPHVFCTSVARGLTAR